MKSPSSLAATTAQNPPRKRVSRANPPSFAPLDPEEKARLISQIRSRARAKVAPPSASRSGYRHSAYYYAYHYGWTRSDATSYAGQYLDFHSYHPQGDRSRGQEFDTTFNPLILGACIMMDIGVAVKYEVEKITNPRKRAAMLAEMRRDLRILRRPFYYARETERRRALARERRKLRRRTTTAPMPTGEDLLKAWAKRKDSKEAMIILGGMVHDLECYVDNSLKFDMNGDVVGRNHGIRGWLKENLPELSCKYKTLMRYKAMAKRLRQATGTEDPTPTSALLEEPQHEAVQAVLRNFRITFSSLEESIAEFVDPEMVLRENPKGNQPIKQNQGLKCTQKAKQKLGATHSQKAKRKQVTKQKLGATRSQEAKRKQKTKQKLGATHSQKAKRKQVTEHDQKANNCTISTDVHSYSPLNSQCVLHHMPKDAEEMADCPRENKQMPNHV